MVRTTALLRLSSLRYPPHFSFHPQGKAVSVPQAPSESSAGPGGCDGNKTKNLHPQIRTPLLRLHNPRSQILAVPQHRETTESLGRDKSHTSHSLPSPGQKQKQTMRCGQMDLRWGHVQLQGLLPSHSEQHTPPHPQPPALPFPGSST